MLKVFESFKAYNKADKAYYNCCPVPWQYRWVPVSAESEWRDPEIVESLPQKDKLRTSYLPIPYCESGIWKDGAHRCPIPQDYRETEIDRDSEYSLTPKFAYKLHDDKPWLKDCPYKLTQGTIKLLATSWQEYKKGKRKAPKFKSQRDGMRTLNDTQTGNATVKAGTIKLPKLGLLGVRSLADRWPESLEVRSYRIMKEPSGYYLLLVGNLPSSPVKESDKACGIDFGLKAAITVDNGRQIEPALPLHRNLKRLRRLQRKVSRQEKGSNGQKKTYSAISRLHETIRRSRKAFAHKVSTKLLREYGAVAIEDIQLTNLNRKPKAKPNESGGFDPNGAAAKAGLNRKFADVGIGQIRTMIEAKAKDRGRETERIPAHHTSQTCNHCGTVDAASRKSQSEFICTECGHSDNADANAAKNILAKSSFFGRYRAWSREFKPLKGGNTPSVQAEPQLRGSRGELSPPISSNMEPAFCKPLQDSQLTDIRAPMGIASAQSTSESYTQLSLWDACAETR